MKAASSKGNGENFASAAALFRALSHPLRVQLVCGLLREPLTQTEIAHHLELTQSLVAQHLAVLRRSGIVRGTRRGGAVVLEVTDPRVPAILTAVCGDARHLLAFRWGERKGR
jgi:ArsR family transcriptional regulator